MPSPTPLPVTDNTVSPATSDAAGGLGDGTSEEPQWGIFKDGVSAVDADSFVSLDFKQEYTISDYPVEQGGFQSFNKVQSPFDVRIQITKGGSIDDRSTFLQQIADIVKSLDLYDVNMPEGTKSNVNFTHQDFQRKAERGATLITVELWGEEVRNTATASFSQTGAGQSQTQNSQGQTEQVTVTGTTKAPSGAPMVNDGIGQTSLVTTTGQQVIANRSQEAPVYNGGGW